MRKTGKHAAALLCFCMASAAFSEELPAPQQPLSAQNSEKLRGFRPRTPQKETQFQGRWMQDQIAAFSSDIGVKTWSVKSSRSTSDAAENPCPMVIDGRQTYSLAAGSVIPALLITGLNSDLPGHLTAQISENVYDSPTGQILLIPQGARLFGEYSSKVVFRQKRPIVRWQRLTFPDGSTLDLEGMPGVDRQGYSGLKDKYNGHYNSMITAAILVSAFSALGEIFDDDDSSVYIGSSSTTVESEVAEAIGDMGEKIFSKFVDRQPTVVIRPGKSFMIQANADIPFTRTWTVR